MKYAIIIPDGAADVPLDELKGRTPFQAADIPTFDWIATHGRIGTVRNIPKELPCGSDVAILSVLGYDPRQCYTGRAPLEAAAQGLQVASDEWIFRCNLVTVIDEVMEDYSAGHISSKEARALIDDLNRQLAGPRVRFYPGVSYRHLMTFKGDCDVKTIAPHDILGQKVAEHLPTGTGADMLRTLTDRSRDVLGRNEINAVRNDLGENPATQIWLWGQGKMPTLEPFVNRFHLHGAAITAVDLVRGLAKLIGWDCIEVEGATGYVDTNYAGKGQAAVEALDKYDLVLVHVEAPDEAGHNANITGKVQCLEQIDKQIVSPVLKRLQKEGEGNWRILVLPDHPTPCTVRTHTHDATPFAVAGARIASVVSGPYNEDTAAASDLHIPRGCDLMEYFVQVR
ncbi:MAG: cofactor-independent phosphoglycerate mutase [Planctomycetes bacterium ADurb.Bin126]|nr:MAG: cofactor-independent phosphoglycerate mutase [Planctomycetes bacterium ADurb.Bin126]HOD84889.1 cofactor-independent phosphoglycerate mutase [Phycisphaerae bacterium]